MIGTCLAHYRIVASLGAGGMGEVYRATDTRLGRDVALKVLPAGVATDAERLERFRREAKALAALDHPGIVTVYSVEEADGVHFLTMQLVQGRPLDTLIPPDGMALDRLLAVGADLAEALAAAHDKGIVHRDLKPANVMVGESGRVRVLDFGLAKLSETGGDVSGSQLATEMKTRSGAVMGTLPYMSPEQVEGRALDARTDVFSLGVMLHEMATGARPFTGDSGPALMSAILRDEPGAVSSLRQGLPADLAAIIGRCLRKAPAERPGSMHVVAEELRRLQRSRTSPPQPAAPSAQRARRRAAVAMGIAATVVVVAIGVAFLMRQSPGGGAPAAPEIPRLAVLPFEDLSPGADQEWFADGTQEALLSALQQIQGMRVTSRTSAMLYRGSDKAAPEIAQELGVRWLVVGSVVRAGDRVRISAQLVDGTADQQVWAQQYERDAQDILAVQSEVARAIVTEIDATVTPDEASRLASAERVDPDAYAAYALGRHHFLRLTPSDFRLSVAAFDRAIAIDPQFAPAHAWLAYTYAFARQYGWMSNAEARPLAEAAVAEAVRLAPGSADTEYALGGLAFHVTGDLEAAERHFRRSAELRDDAMTIDTLSFVLVQMGRADEAVAVAQRAVELDPLSPVMRNDLGWWKFAARDYEGTVAEAMRAYQLDPLFPEVQWLLALAYSQLGRFPEADAARARYEELYGQRNYSLAGYLQGRAGERDAALASLAALQQRVDTGQSLDIERALIYLGLGDQEAVLQVLEAAPESNITFMPYLYPEYEPLRGNPRFQAVLRRFGFPVRGN